MDKEEYFDEIGLIREQNNTEIELYPLVSEIIAPTLKGLSKRYVFSRRISKLGLIFYGISKFPDIAILDRDFRNKKNSEVNGENWLKLRGCVEAKALDVPLCNLNDLKGLKDPNKSESEKQEAAELLGEILWYKKVLYTNGIVWKVFSFDSHCDFKDKIVEIAVDSKGQSEWWKNDTVIDIANTKISEMTISTNCLENWDEFINNIKGIKWDESLKGNRQR